VHVSKQVISTEYLCRTELLLRTIWKTNAFSVAVGKWQFFTNVRERPPGER